MIIYLDDDEIKDIADHVNWINNQKKQDGIKDRRQNVNAEQDILLQGLLGEYAFCKAFDLVYEKKKPKYGDSGDVILRNKTFDIKTSQNYELNIKQDKLEKYDGFIAIQSNSKLTMFDILGVISTSKARQVAIKIFPENRDPFWRIEVDKLTSIETFALWAGLKKSIKNT